MTADKRFIHIHRSPFKLVSPFALFKTIREKEAVF